MLCRSGLPPILALVALFLTAATCARESPEEPVPAARTPGEIARGSACGPSRVVLGVNDQGAADPELVSRAGLAWVRATIPWREVNPARGTWRWEAADPLVRPHHAAGHRVLAVLSTAPEWAGSNERGTRPPEEIARWSEYVGRLAQRYRAEIDAYEIWNEPDRRDEGIGVGWDRPPGEPPTYAEYLRAAALAVREHDPGAKIVAPALGSDPRAATAALLRHLEEAPLADGRPADFFDVVSLHANARGDESSGEVWDRLRQHLRTLVARAPSLRDKPVWITELGWPSDEVGEAGQAEKIENLLAEIAGPWQGIDHPAYCGRAPEETLAFLYKLQDGGGESRGIFTDTGQPKPVVRRLRSGEDS